MFQILYDPMDCTMPAFPVLYYLPEFAQIHVHLSQWWFLTISSTVTNPFYFCIQSFLASESLPMSQLFTLGGLNIAASTTASVLSIFRVDLFKIDWFDLLVVQGILKSLLECHNLRASVLQCSAFFMVQLSHLYMTTGKTIIFTTQTFVGKVMSLLFNTPYRFVISVLPRSKCLFFSKL